MTPYGVGDVGERGIRSRPLTPSRSAPGLGIDEIDSPVFSGPRREGVGGACEKDEREGGKGMWMYLFGGGVEFDALNCARSAILFIARRVTTHLELHRHRLNISPFQAHSLEDPPPNPVDPVHIVPTPRPYLDPINFWASGRDNPANFVIRVENLADEIHGEVRPGGVEERGRRAEEDDPFATLSRRSAGNHYRGMFLRCV